ncbi:NUDIX domain-containing protein [candidate division WWE3 bacterium]|uniref:NUDIX domain-containing protein n=1 Tax=candidate division WWE3 bacterium TaxID=2053526 RepID=A0A955RPT3_UNCKA|nr:NUDIX domain-containing protein [candidate division WWE3 bacterium]
MNIDSEGASLILIDGNHALMMLRDNKEGLNYANHWCLNGGAVEPNETPKEAAIRELYEETNYHAREPIYFMTEVYALPNGKVIKAHRFFEIYDNQQELTCLEGQKLSFIPFDELLTLTTVPGHAESAQRAITLAQFILSKNS